MLDSKFWTGILVGGVATLLLIFGIVVVGSAAMGGAGAMMPMMMNGMDADEMEAMHERCHEMMDERTPVEEPPEGEDAPAGGRSGAAVGSQSLVNLLP